MNKASLFFLLLGITLVIVAYSSTAEAGKITDLDHDIERVDKEIKDARKRDKRAPDDDEDSGSKKKSKRKRKSPSTPAPDGSTTTDSPSTTAAPDSSTTSGKPKTSTTKKSKSKSADKELDSAADNEFYDELIADKDNEKVLINKANAAIKAWIGWLEAHDHKTLNKGVAQQFLSLINIKLVNEYHVGSPVCGPKPPIDDGFSIPLHPARMGRRRHYDFSRLN